MKKLPSSKKPATTPVDEYISAAPQNVRDVLQQLRTAITAAVPQAEERISYGIPTYKWHGPLVHFAVQKNHCSLTVVSKSAIETFARELTKFKVSGRTIHFTPEQPIPATLVKKIVKLRVKENETRKKK